MPSFRDDKCPCGLPWDKCPWSWTAKTEPCPRAAYRDSSFNERECDHCGERYRGPAVYCSLTCALADA
jgi:hypothetical protein